MKSLALFGTTSDAGKSCMTMALCNIFQSQGYKVSPFKAQNMSNNSAVCDDGSEIGRAQFFQAESIGLRTSYHLNPVLLKPQGRGMSHLVLKGKFDRSIHVKDYYEEIERLKPVVDDCFNYLKEHNDFVIVEGAGSPVELNLLKRDIANYYMADRFNLKVIIVADIERGGVFASIYGTYHLLPDKIKQNVIGVIINKFRGDISLFDEGIRIIENQWKIKVLGIIPYRPLKFDFEDSLSLNLYQKVKTEAIIEIGIVKFPHISNYNDIDPLMADPNINIEFIESFKRLQSYDLIILPGTKTTIADLRWLKKIGLFGEISQYKGYIFGICGGYQMFFKEIEDREGVESDSPTSETGLAFIDATIAFHSDKILNRGKYFLFDRELTGYEIHCGRTEQFNRGYHSDKIWGTHLHGIFDNDSFKNDFLKLINERYDNKISFRQYKREQLDSFVQDVQSHLNVQQIIQSLKE